MPPVAASLSFSVPEASRTVRFGSTAEVLAKCMPKYYRISECPGVGNKCELGRLCILQEHADTLGEAHLASLSPAGAAQPLVA